MVLGSYHVTTESRKTQKGDDNRSHPHLGSKGMSPAYALIYGLIGLGICGFLYTVMDQVVLGDVWNFAIDQQLNGNQLQMFATMFKFIPVVFVGAAVIGWIANAHITKNDPYA